MKNALTIIFWLLILTLCMGIMVYSLVTHDLANLVVGGV